MVNVYNVRIQYLYDTEENWISKDPQLSSNGEAYIFETPDGCGLKIGDGVHNICELEYTIEPQSDIIITEVPYVNQTYVYRGETIYPEFVGYNAAMLSISGDVSGQNAGTYSVTFTPRDGYVWFDGTKDAKAITWVIDKAETVVTVTPTSITAYEGFETVVTVETNNSSATISATTFEDGITFEVLNSTSIKFYHDTKYELTSSETNVVVVVQATTNYSEASTSIPVKVITDLESCTWEQISEISASGNASNIFSIGDRKKIVLNGTVGTLTLSNYETYVYIIGFDHTNGTAGTDYGIHFGTFKNADGKDICLDTNYSSSSTIGLKYFNMSHWGNYYGGNYNYGGWRGCDMRYDILGSTDVAPSGYGSTPTTSRTGYDATTTCATNPVANTLMDALPEDLRKVLKPMIKYTDGKGNYSDTSADVVATVDYLPLLAEFEVYGSSSYANTYEKNSQTQYAYFINGNRQEKYKYSATGTAAGWWLRSVYYSSSSSFCVVSAAGGSDINAASISLGVSPTFKI